MKRSSTFVKKHAELLYGLVAAVKEMYHAITSITGKDYIPISEYSHYKGVGKSVRGYAKVNTPYSPGDMQTGRITTVCRPDNDKESVHFKVWSLNGDRDDDIYQYSVDEILAVYEQLEAIYQYEKKSHKQETLA